MQVIDIVVSLCHVLFLSWLGCLVGLQVKWLTEASTWSGNAWRGCYLLCAVPYVQLLLATGMQSLSHANFRVKPSVHNFIKYLVMCGGVCRPAKESSNNVHVLSSWAEPLLSTCYAWQVDFLCCSVSISACNGMGNSQSMPLTWSICQRCEACGENHIV